MLREERESARADRHAWAAEQRRLRDEVELRVQLALSGRQSQSAAHGSPAIEGRKTTNFGGANLGTFRMRIPPGDWLGMNLQDRTWPLPVLHTPRVRGLAEGAAAVERCWFKEIAHHT